MTRRKMNLPGLFSSVVVVVEYYSQALCRVIRRQPSENYSGEFAHSLGCHYDMLLCTLVGRRERSRDGTAHYGNLSGH